MDKKVDMVKKGAAVNLNKDDSSKQLEPKNEGKKVNDGDSRDDKKDNKGLDSKSKEGSLSPPREKCDPSSNSYTDDDKTLIACLRVPGDGTHFKFFDNCCFCCLWIDGWSLFTDWIASHVYLEIICAYVFLYMLNESY